MLRFFPRGVMKGDDSLNSMDLSMNLDLDATRGKHPENSFGGSERRYQFNLHPVWPMDLCNNNKKNDNMREDPDSSGIYSAKSIPDSPKRRMKVKAKSKSPAQSKSSRSNKTPYGDGDLLKNHDFDYIWRGLLSDPESMSSHSTNHAELKVNRAGTVRPERSLMTEACVLNRNLADFTVPEAGYEYTRGYGDFKLKEKVLSEM